VVSDDLTSEWLTVPSGPPVGVSGDRPESVVVAFGIDEIMLCFTDGVIERPGVTLDDGVAHLAARLLGRLGADQVSTTTTEVVEVAMDAAVEFADRRDDAVAVALRLT